MVFVFLGVGVTGLQAFAAGCFFVSQIDISGCAILVLKVDSTTLPENLF